MPLGNELYDNAVDWINENPEDDIAKEIKQDFLHFNALSPEKKGELLIILNTLSETKKLPLVIEKSLPYVMFNIGVLPIELITQSQSSESNKKNIAATSKRMFSLFQSTQLLDNFLQQIAYGEQDKIERLFKGFYKENVEKIQTALCYKGKLTDYSGRTFDCTAYEYAYWAKDTHMCRMLEQYMDEETKAKMLQRCVAIEDNGLNYIQNELEKNSPHFDFTPLQTALTTFIDKAEDANSQWKELLFAWMNIFKMQCDVPVHVAHEYCRPDRTFSPLPKFNEESLPRVLLIGDSERGGTKQWFPLKSIDVVTRWKYPQAITLNMSRALDGELDKLKIDLKAIKQLDMVRTADLTHSRDNLKVAPASDLQPPQ